MPRACWQCARLVLVAVVLAITALPSPAQESRSVIVTHWDDGWTPGWKIGETGLVQHENPLTYFPSNYDSYYTYNPILPTYLPYKDIYVGESFSPGNTVRESLRDAFSTFVAARTGVSVVHINFGVTGWVDDLLEPLNKGKLRVLHNVIFDYDGDWLEVESSADGDECLATLLFPPDWEWVEDPPPAEVYPILCACVYDPNQEFGRLSNYDDADGNPVNGTQYRYMNGMFVAEQVALSPGWDPTLVRPGAIGILWNGGGTWATVSMNGLAYGQFARMIDTVAKRFGGNRNEIVMFGHSKGGMGTIGMACRPLSLVGSEPPYKIVAACATEFAGRPGSVFNVISPTYPMLLANAALFTGFRNAWKHNWHYPPPSNPFWETRPELGGMLGKDACAVVATGATDMADADENFSITSWNFIENGLDEQNPPPILYLGIATHDAYFPTLYSLEFLNKVKRITPITPLVDFAIRGGHGVMRMEYDLGTGYDLQSVPSSYFHAYRALYNLFDNGSVAFDWRADWEMYWVYDDEGQILPMPEQPTIHPFTMEAPARAFVGRAQMWYPDEQFPIVLTGEPGTQFGLVIQNMDEPPGVHMEWTGSIPYADKQGVVLWVEPTDLWGTKRTGIEFADCRYVLSINPPGSSEWFFLQQPPRNQSTVPAGHLHLYPAAHHEGKGGANGSGAQAMGFVSPYDENQAIVGWGLSEY